MAVKEEKAIYLPKEIKVEITREEKRAIKQLWGDVFKFRLEDVLPYYKVTKYFNGFDERYVPGALYIPYICYGLNPIDAVDFFSHKGILDVVCQDVNRPVTILKTLGTLLLDSSNKILDFNSAVDLVAGETEPLILKLSVDSSQGRNIVKLEPGQSKESIADILRDYSKVDFVIQRFVKQSAQTAKFNPTSLNCFRITTLNINGTISVCSRAIKVGAVGKFVDNIGGGSGGVIVGVDSEGKLDAFGYDKNGRRESRHGDVDFGIPQHINGFEKIDRFAVELHERIPNIGIIGWDVALDENDAPLLIEANTIWPGIRLEQVCSGPIFGDRTEEVLEYLKEHPYKRKKLFHF